MILISRLSLGTHRNVCHSCGWSCRLPQGTCLRLFLFFEAGGRDGSLATLRKYRRSIKSFFFLLRNYTLICSRRWTIAPLTYQPSSVNKYVLSSFSAVSLFPIPPLTQQDHPCYGLDRSFNDFPYSYFLRSVPVWFLTPALLPPSLNTLPPRSKFWVLKRLFSGTFLKTIVALLLNQITEWS